MLAVLTPLGRVADEPAHAMRAASLLHGQWIGRRAPVVTRGGAERVMAGLDADKAMLGVQGGSDRPKLLQDYADWSGAQAWAGTRQFHEAANVAVYMPVFYAPAAVGMGIAKAAGAGPFGATYAARLVNVACFAALGVSALLLAHRGHALLFCTLTVPMTLGLAGSVNQDGLIIGSSALAAALLTRGAASAPPGQAYWAAAVLLACIVAVKPPYAPLLVGLLFPLPPVRAWLRLRGPLLSRVAAVGLALLPGLLWGWLAATTVATPFDRPPYEAGPLWPGPRPAVFDGTDPAAQLTVLLADPWRVLTLPWDTITHDRALLRSIVGLLGWLDVFLPDALYGWWFMAVPAALLHDLAGRGGGRGWGSAGGLVLCLAAAASCVLGLYLLQYLIWTPVGHAEVQGVQGRYMLPILPLLALCLPAFDLKGGSRLRAALVALPAAAVAAGVAVLPPLVVHAMILR